MSFQGNGPNPPWVQALLDQMYPGGGSNLMTQGFKPMPMPAYPMVNKVGTGFVTSPFTNPNSSLGKLTAADPRLADATMNAMTGMAPASGAGRPTITANPANSPGGAGVPLPPPDPRRVGGAPTPGVPSPQGVNRTANNPNLIQYMVGGNARSGGFNPIYTTRNFGPQGGVPAPSPQGALSSPQAPLRPPVGLPHDPATQTGFGGGALSGGNFMDWLRTQLGGGNPLSAGGAYSP